MREFIVEADGGSRGNPGPAGYGAVVSDAATGETLAEAAEYLGTTTNNVAEYSGLLAGLRAAHALDPRAAVHVRMDSKLVVEQMSGRWKVKHPAMKPLAAEAARVFPPGRVTYEWIPRERNKHADRLANEAMDAGQRGERWSASASRAALDTPAARPVTPEPSGPPGDAAAGAARVRAALASATAAPATEPGATESGVTEPGTRGAGSAGDALDEKGADGKAAADLRAAQAVAAPGTETAAPGMAPAAVPSPGWAPADMGPPATFVLLRHGETPLTPQKRFSGSGGSDPSLSDAGREQAERTAAALARRGTVQAVVASPLARTRETAGIVAARLGLEVSVEEGLRETDFGAWEGLTFAEVRERHPDDLNAWLSSPDAEPTGGGESFAATAHRVAAARDRLTAAYAGRTVLLVTHVTPIKTLVRLALGAPPEALFRMELSAASLSAVAYYADGNASVRLFNETSHLR
ncbi:bifunctional RNase H/acid phosphatase [Streptomyces prasinopilosus]|uniref:Probable phosphoglycerate mutase n=1 Tax=Streptomyces prasinopilosus TaxID=67344 RepID=A0A1G6JJ86_9ACTN|nr:bifunctional RNase H/acid phosphatase [Streptomyces prasinopilosus]SDC18006.1 probable phosphoglycerate mutase [Streptomyces prasinopilosus]